MRQLEEYREKLIVRLGEAADEFRSACLASERPLDPIDGGWSVHRIAVHTRDVDQLVYGSRARRTLAENNPVFANFDGDRYMAEHYDANEALRDVLDSFVESTESVTKLLREMPVEGWSRKSRHETLGEGITTQAWVERGLAHVEEHLATVRKAQGVHSK